MTDMEIINNPWVTGIGGGIISSLIVYFVTRYAFSKKERKEYNQKLETANNEILYALRPLIIEKKIPSIQIFSSVRFSTAKKYGVQPEDLYNTYSISNDLINEIMNNSFLSSDQKIELCELLNAMKNPEQKGDKEKSVEVIYLKKGDWLSSKYNSMLLAAISFMMVITMTLFISINSNSLNNTVVLQNKFPIYFIAILIPIVSFLLLYLLNMLRNRERGSDYTKRSQKEFLKENE